MIKCKSVTLIVQILSHVSCESESYATDMSFSFNISRDIMNTFITKISCSMKEQKSQYLNAQCCHAEVFCFNGIRRSSLSWSRALLTSQMPPRARTSGSSINKSFNGPGFLQRAGCTQCHRAVPGIGHLGWFQNFYYKLSWRLRPVYMKDGFTHKQY